MAPDAMAKPADAAAEAIDAVRAVPTCPSTRFVEMNVLTNYCLRCCVPRAATGSV